MSKEKVIRFGIIGLGKRAFDSFIPVIKKNRNWIIDSVCDVNEDQLKSFIKEFAFENIKLYNDFSELMKERSKFVDVAIVAVPHQLHFIMTKSLLEVGIHVLKEKPFALNYQEANKLQELATKHSVKLSCAIQRRFSKYFLECQNALTQIGSIKYIHARKFLTINNLSEGWRSLNGGGALIDVGIHLIDLMFSFFGKPNKIESNLVFKTRALQNYDVEDSIQILGSWLDKDNNEFSGTIEISRVGLFKQEFIEVTGTNGYLMISIKETKVYDIKRNEIGCFINNCTDYDLTQRNIEDFITWVSCPNDRKIKAKFESFLIRDLQITQMIDEIYKSEKIKPTKQSDYTWPRITPNLEKAVIEQLHTSLSIYDRSGIIAELETNFKEYLGVKDNYALLCNSGSMAIDSMYRAIELMPNDLVIVPVYTFHATVSPLMHYGAIPIFCDSDSNGIIAVEEIKKIINSLTKKPKAIVVTHMWGSPANIRKIAKFCKSQEIYLLEDCSHAHGALVNGQFVGTFGDAAAWSFQGQKILTGGEGGILVTRHKDMYYRALIHGHYNKRCDKEIEKEHALHKYFLTGDGFKLRIHPLSAAIANQQLKELNLFIEIKNYFANKLVNGLKHIRFLKMPNLRSAENSPSWYAFIMNFCENSAPKQLTREIFCKALLDAGLTEIDIPNSTRLLHKEPLFNEPHFVLPHIYGTENSETARNYKVQFDKYCSDNFKNSEHFHETAIKLPVWAFSDEEYIVDRYIETISRVAQQCVENNN